VAELLGPFRGGGDGGGRDRAGRDGDGSAQPRDVSAPGPRAATIFAPATAAAPAAIGVVRLSGPATAAALRAVAGDPLPPPRRAVLRRLRHPRTGEVLDRGLVLWLPGPRTYTGEDMAELHHHGGVAVRAALLEALETLEGLRPAEPGEFTRRAFLAGRMDLTEAEAVADLVEATTAAQRRLALRGLEGELGRRLEAWRGALLDLLARVEAVIDFGAEEADVPADPPAEVAETAGRLAGEMRRLLAGAVAAERLARGIQVAVTGPPNVGKSSLVNRLARREVAIVTPIPGTTRDVLEVALDLGGLPVTLLDTAGLRETADPVEAEGVRRARARAAAADLELRLVAATEPGPEPAAEPRVVPVVTKVDLAPPPAWRVPFVAVSAVTGEGLERLVAALRARAAALVAGAEEAPMTRARQREALAEAAAALERIRSGAATETVLVAEELRIAARALGRITGRVEVEEVLDRVFARFCIGK